MLCFSQFCFVVLMHSYCPASISIFPNTFPFHHINWYFLVIFSLSILLRPSFTSFLCIHFLCFSHFPLIPLKFLPHPLPYFLHSFYFYLINFSLFFCIISVISLHSPREINAASFACFPFLFFIFLTFPFYLKRFTTASERGRCISVPLCACRHECRLSILSSPPRQVRHSRELRNSWVALFVLRVWGCPILARPLFRSPSLSLALSIFFYFC